MAARGGGRVVGVVFRLALPGLLGLAAPCPAHAAAPAGQWWNAGYRYRQQLSLTSGTTPIPTQYSVRLQLAHAALVSVSKSLGHARGIPVGELRLERQGQPAAFHVEPATGSFGPGAGSRLLFFAEAAADSLAFSPETAWELLHAREGLRMPVASAAPPSTAVRTAPSRRARFELNRFYQPGLLKASDLWLWEAVPAGAARTLTLSLSGVDPGASFVARLACGRPVGRGAVRGEAAVSEGLSLDGPAHQYHRALMAELTSGCHGRLGAAILAAQRTYTQSGPMPELLAIYALLGDPAMPVR